MTRAQQFSHKENPLRRTIYLIDGSSFLYRAYYGMRPLHTREGEPVHAVYSFCRMIRKLIKTFSPQYMAIVWDSKGKTERHEVYEAYKATRQAPPSDLWSQKKWIQQFADGIGIAQYEKEGIEADDLIYSLTKESTKAGHHVVIVSSDKDLAQLLNEQVKLYDAFKEQLFSRHDYEEKMEFPVDRLPLYFALLGDSSDNIPGVRGIGKKGATELAQQFATLDELYANLEKVTNQRIKKALEANKSQAFLSLELFSLRYHAMQFSITEAQFEENNWQKARQLFEKLQFTSLLRELPSLPQQTFLFGASGQEELFFAEEKGYQFILVVDEQKLQQVATELQETGACALDTETTGVNSLENPIVGLSICTQKGRAYYIPFGHMTEEKQLDRTTVFSLLGPLLEDPKIEKWLHNAKFDQLVFSVAGSTLQGVSFDTLIAANLVTEDWQRIGLKQLSERFLNEKMLTYEAVAKKFGVQTFAQIPLAEATNYAAADAHQTWQLKQLFEKKLQEENLFELFMNIEMPLSQVLFKMEQAGVYCDGAALAELGKVVAERLATLDKEMRDLTGVGADFNFNSPKQLGDLLFNQLGLPPQKKSAKGAGFSTDVEVLTFLSHRHLVPNLLLQYRELYKLKSTYIDALPSYINPHTGRIHTSFSQTATATGRLASSEPNLQNIPASGSKYGKYVRAAFKPTKGHLFLSADYSQIELRVLAELSGDTVLRQAFKKGRDIHKETASRLFDVALDQVTVEQRQVGKRINFSILYGLTPYGLSKDLGLSLKDAKFYIEKYFEQYPGVSAWMDKVIAQAKEYGYVTTHWGRRRYVPGIYEKNKNLYEAARRIAINTVAQGTAAEIVKIGMVNLDRELVAAGVDAALLLQIHDELLISVGQQEAKEVEKLTKQVLEGVVNWSIPLEVTTRFGNNWAEATK